jgi:CRISPR-associated protein (TIGR03984 family)
MTRKITGAKPARLEKIATGDLVELKPWLEKKAKKYELKWLLAHLDDGVVWGRILDAGPLATSDEVLKDMKQHDNLTVKADDNFTPPLRLETLQQARLFGEKAELLLWRDGDNELHARLIADVTDTANTTWPQCFDEPQLLWGTHGIPANDDFTLIWEGSQGMHQIIPIKLDVDGDNKIVKGKEPKLRVRHYLNKKEEGEARMVASRLVGIDNKAETES